MWVRRAASSQRAAAPGIRQHLVELLLLLRGSAILQLQRARVGQEGPRRRQRPHRDARHELVHILSEVRNQAVEQHGLRAHRGPVAALRCLFGPAVIDFRLGSHALQERAPFSLAGIFPAGYLGQPALERRGFVLRERLARRGGEAGGQCHKAAVAQNPANTGIGAARALSRSLGKPCPKHAFDLPAQRRYGRCPPQVFPQF